MSLKWILLFYQNFLQSLPTIHNYRYVIRILFYTDFPANHYTITIFNNKLTIK